VITVAGLRKSFGSTLALAGLSFEVRKGEVFGLVGPDGAGKSTLIRILAGILAKDAGDVAVSRPLGYIPQRFSLYGDLTVEENIDFFAGLYGLQGGQRKEELLRSIGLERFRTRLASALSGGMKQKLALLCCLVHSPKLLLMDEPTTGVDPVSRREFWSLVFALQGQGHTVLASTPYMDEAEQFDRVALIDKGKFVTLGTTAEIKAAVPGVVLELACDKPFAARERLAPLEVELFGDRVHVFLNDDSPAQRQQILAKVPGQLKRIPYSIEDVFLRLSR